MELQFDKLQIDESLAIYRQKNEVLQAEIREELQKRKELKIQIQEAEARYQTQIHTASRLNEYEKFIDRELEKINQRKDDESISLSNLIKEYDEMLRIQENVWESYKSQYEQFPMSVQVNTERINLLKLTIECGLLKQKLIDLERIEEQRRNFELKKERAQIVRIAKLYKEFRQSAQFEEAQKQEIKNVENRIEQAKFETQKIEKQLKNEENLKCRQLNGDQQPQLDLQIVKFIEYQHQSNYDMADDISCNTLMLEEEFHIGNIFDKPLQTFSKVESCPVTSEHQNKNECVTREVQSESFETSKMDVGEQPQTSSNVPLTNSNMPLENGPSKQKNEQQIPPSTTQQLENNANQQKINKRPPSKSFDSSETQNVEKKKPRIVQEKVIKPNSSPSPISKNSMFSTRMDTDSFDNISDIMSDFDDPATERDFTRRVRGGSFISEFDVSYGQSNFNEGLGSPTRGINIPMMSPSPVHPKEFKNADKPSNTNDADANLTNKEASMFMPGAQGKRNTKFF